MRGKRSLCLQNLQTSLRWSCSSRKRMPHKFYHGLVRWVENIRVSQNLSYLSITWVESQIGCPRHLIKMCPLLLFSKETRFFLLDTSQNSQVNYEIPCFSLTPKRLGNVCLFQCVVGLMMNEKKSKMMLHYKLLNLKDIMSISVMKAYTRISNSN